jgi:hypothetical protein
MSGFDVVVALFAGFMMVRHAPRAVRALRGEGRGTAAMVSIVNVVLAAVIFVVAVKGMVGVLISR